MLHRAAAQGSNLLRKAVEGPRSTGFDPSGALCHLFVSRFIVVQTAMQQHHGSIIWEPYTKQFTAYQEETKVLSESSLDDLVSTRKAQTQALQSNPKEARLWIARAQTHLSLRYPELAVYDAYRALRLLEDLIHSDDRLKLARYKAALVLCEGLFFTRSFKDCLHFIQTFREQSSQNQTFIEPLYLTRLRRLRTFATVCFTRQRQGDATPHEYGEIQASGYPWTEQQHLERNGEVQAVMSREILMASKNACSMGKSCVPSSLVENCHGMYANADIYDEEETVFIEKPALAASDYVGRKCCVFCFALLNTEKETAAIKAGYCSSICQRKYVSSYGRIQVSAADDASVQELVKSCVIECDANEAAKQTASLNLLYRCVRSMIHQMRRRPHLRLHPLDTSPICRLVGFASTPRIAPFSFESDIKAPLQILSMLGVNIARDLRFDADILFTISGRLEMNSWEDEQEMPDGNMVIVTGVNCAYNLLNHSCEPNVACVRDSATGNLVVQTRRDIKAGEEMYLSYVDDEILEGDRDTRLKALENWMGDRPHHCPRCYPPSQPNMAVNEGSSVPTKRKRDDAVMPECESMLHNARRTRREPWRGDIPEASAGDYSSEHGFEEFT